MTKRWILWALALALLCGAAPGCDDEPADGDGDADSDGDSDGDADGDSDGDSDGDADGDSDGDADGDGDADQPSVCPDGAVQSEEECDDGNETAGDGCSPTCTFERCGDGVVGELSEISYGFEEGSPIGTNWENVGWERESERAASGTYALVSTNHDPNTRSSLRLTAPSDGEVCFSFAGSTESGYDALTFLVDGVERGRWSGVIEEWTTLCRFVDPGVHDFEWVYAKDQGADEGWDAFYLDDIRVRSASIEDCDDGNVLSGDGCSALCTEDTCGDGIVDLGESCDDGNTEAGDGCSSTCEYEWCGDGVVSDLPALADDFETGDLTRLGWITGDAPWGWVVESDHVHDGSSAIGPTNVGVDVAIASIEVEAYSDGEVCFWLAGSSDGFFDWFRFLVDGEVAEEWTGSDHEIWTEYCLSVAPGVHVFEWVYTKDERFGEHWDAFYVDDVTFSAALEEECDDGEANDDLEPDACRTTCHAASCGDGVVDTGEECDDGNLEDGDGCSATCTVERD